MLKKNILIGNTPLVKINYKYQGKQKRIYAKLEYFKKTESIKDRDAYYILENAKKCGELKEKMPIVEATSGNTGISLAALGAYYNHPVYIFMPDWVSKERLELMKCFGANIILISKEGGGFIRCVEEAKKMAEEKGGFLSNQFANKDNFQAHYETTGREIIEQAPEELGGFVSGVGTGGTLMGIGTRLKEKFKDLKTVAVEPDKMPIISQGKKIDQHKIEGIGDDFVPDLIDKDKIDKIILVNDEDSINMSRIFAKKLGLGVGISSGADFIGSVLLNEELENPVVTVFADDNKKYLSTDLSKELDNNKNFISNQIKLINYEVV